MERRDSDSSKMAFPQQVASSGPFDRLPTETIHQILSSVPPDTKACLTLCNKKLNMILGNKYVLPLRKRNHRGRPVFLRTLDRDLTDSFFCHNCKKIHLLRRITEDALTADELFKRVSNSRCSNNLKADAAKYNQQAAYIYRPGLKFEHLYMAMKLHRQDVGPSFLRAYLGLLQMSHPLCRAMVVSDGVSTCEGFYFFEPHIINGRIFVRAQSWFHIPRGECPVILMEGICQFDACAHVNFNVRWANTLLEKLKHGTHPSPHTFRKGACSIQCRSAEFRERLHCSYCPTTVLLEAKNFDAAGLKGTAVVVTKWQCLGSGNWPDEFWEGPLKSSRRHPSWFLPPPPSTQLHFPVDSNEAIWIDQLEPIFERAAGIRYDSILDMNRALELLEERSSIHSVGRRVVSSRVLIEGEDEQW